MPDTPDFDEARRSLDEVPAPDLWAEAERRAAAGGVAPLVRDGDRARRPGRWLAAAAAAALVAGTIAVLSTDDDDQVDTTPEATTTPTTVIGDAGCRFGITPPTDFQPGLPDPPIFDAKPQSADQTVVHKDLGDQVLEIRVPGLVVIDLVGERVEQVELRRGTADVWFGPDFVQVRWFTGSQEPCGSFTVTVAGGTEDGNRHAAVDWAERISLPGELEAADDAPLAGTQWQLERSTVDGQPTDGGGSTFVFGADRVSWSDGCNAFEGAYAQPNAAELVVRGDDPATEVTGSAIDCDPSPTSDAIGAVMTSKAIAVTYDGDLLVLTAGEVVLWLRPAAPDTADFFAIWPETDPLKLPDEEPAWSADQAETALEFARQVLGWEDAAYVPGDSEPLEDGLGGAALGVESPSRGANVRVTVHPMVAGRYRVSALSPLHEYSVSVSVVGRDAVVSLSWDPAEYGATACAATFTYAGRHVLAALGQHVDLGFAPDTRGAVRVLCRDAEDQVVTGWATALPAGDFAAG